jgi:hypothetical protein
MEKENVSGDEEPLFTHRNEFVESNMWTLKVKDFFWRFFLVFFLKILKVPRALFQPRQPARGKEDRCEEKA